MQGLARWGAIAAAKRIELVVASMPAFFNPWSACGP
jgi:hypothetical protein